MHRIKPIYRKFSRSFLFVAALGILGIISFHATISRAQEKAIYPGYPVAFDGRGYLDGMHDGKIIISDSSYSLAAGTTFNTPNALNAGSSAFQAGDVVGFLLDADGKIESVWLIERNPKKK